MYGWVALDPEAPFGSVFDLRLRPEGSLRVEDRPERGHPAMKTAPGGTNEMSGSQRHDREGVLCRGSHEPPGFWETLAETLPKTLPKTLPDGRVSEKVNWVEYPTDYGRAAPACGRVQLAWTCETRTGAPGQSGCASTPRGLIKGAGAILFDARVASNELRQIRAIPPAKCPRS